MRTHWIFLWALAALVVGCSVPGFPGGPRLAQQPQSTEQADWMAPAPSPSFTQRIAATVMSGKSAQAAKTRARQQLDPISFGFASGPPNAELYLSMAKLSDRGGNFAYARSMYHRSLGMDPRNLEALLGLARLEDREGRLDEALRIYQQAVAAYPQNVKSLNDLALCHARKGELQPSLELLKRAARLQPEKPLYRNNIAKVLTEMNRVDEAANNLAAVYPPAVVNYNMGVLLHERGQSQEAVKYLTAATKMDPQLEQASILLSQLTSAVPQYAQRPPASNDHILPTPMTLPNQTAMQSGSQRYPTTSAPTALPSYQTVPAETAQAPQRTSPVLLPPIR